MIYCLCGREFPTGNLKRRLWPYDGVQYADNRCPECVDRTGSYRFCSRCSDLFAPITSDAEDRYNYCSTECEPSGNNL